MASITLTLSSVRNKKTNKSEILLRYRNTSKVALRPHTHIYVLPEFFSDGQIVINKRRETEEVKEARAAKTTLDAMITLLEEKGSKMDIDDIGPGWAQDVIDRFMFPVNYKKADKEHICFNDKTEEFLKYKKLSAERVHTYQAVFRIIERYQLYTGKVIVLDKANSDTLVALDDFFRTEHTLFEPVQLKYRMGLKPVKKYKYAWDHTKHERALRERSNNAIVSYMSAVRAYWRWCIDMGYTKNDPFRKYSVGSQKYGTPYYLTTEERDLLYKTDMGKDKDLTQARDIFIFQCYIGCRISDLLSFTEGNIVTTDNGVSVQYEPSKTKEERPSVVKVYLAPTAIEILERYKGTNRSTIFPYYSTGKLNDLIRASLKKAGITRVVTIVNPRTKQSEQYPICDITSSHMARRTFIGNLYKKLKDPNLVGKLADLKNQKDGKLVDHIYLDKSLIGKKYNIYYIGDSKYYQDGLHPEGVALYKQFTYARNAIQYNIEQYNLKHRKNPNAIRYRDEETDGYNITPNFFISPKIERGNLDFNTPSFVPSDWIPKPNKHFEDRLFDRDTLLLREYNINLIFLIAAYGAYEDCWTNTLRTTIREDMIQLLNKLYVFFEVVPEPIPVYSEDRKVMEIPFLNYHHNRLRGKVYKIDDKTKSLIIAFERDTDTGHADLQEVRDNIATSISGGSIDTPIKLEP